MSFFVQDLARKIEAAFVDADLHHSANDDTLIGYRHLALIAAVVALEQGIVTAGAGFDTPSLREDGPNRGLAV